MQISDIVGHLESLAPPAYQEPYDNAGLLTGSGTWECTGVLTTLDATEEVVKEAVARVQPDRGASSDHLQGA
jgi:putative NIF3 family GTP cyclohydrolase 1 type 2